MNKDIDNINNTDESVEKALDIMESSSEINDEQLQEMLKDKEVLQACRDIMDSSLFLQQKGGIELPNVEMELERFKKKTTFNTNAFQSLEDNYRNSRHDYRSIRELLFN